MKEEGNNCYILKKIKGGIACVKEHGMKYTVYYGAQKIFCRIEKFIKVLCLNIKREIHYYNSGSIILTLSNENIVSEDILKMRGEFNMFCLDIVQQLYAYDVINENTSDIDKAKTFFEYVALHCDYDLNYGINSYTGYGAAIEGLAVCQGYTAMFNNLCRIEGIDVKGISGRILTTDEPHMWTSITIPDSNTVIYCDVTFGDPILGEGFEDNIDMKYFNISYEELMQDRIEDWAS